MLRHVTIHSTQDEEMVTIASSPFYSVIDDLLTYILAMLNVTEAVNFALTNHKHFALTQQFFNRKDSTVTLDALIKAVHYSDAYSLLKRFTDSLPPIFERKFNELKKEEENQLIKKSTFVTGSIGVAATLLALWLIKWITIDLGPDTYRNRYGVTVYSFTRPILLTIAVVTLYCLHFFALSYLKGKLAINHATIRSLALSEFDFSKDSGFNNDDPQQLLKLLKITDQMQLSTVMTFAKKAAINLQKQLGALSLPSNIKHLPSVSLFKVKPNAPQNQEVAITIPEEKSPLLQPQ
jgi:hypothetical protein